LLTSPAVRWTTSSSQLKLYSSGGGTGLGLVLRRLWLQGSVTYTVKLDRGMAACAAESERSPRCSGSTGTSWPARRLDSTATESRNTTWTPARAATIASLGVRPGWTAVAGYALAGIVAGLVFAVLVAWRAVRGRTAASGRLGTMSGRRLALEPGGLVAAVALVAGAVGLSAPAREVFEVTGHVTGTERGIDMPEYMALTLEGTDTLMWAELDGVQSGDWVGMRCAQKTDFPAGECTCWDAWIARPAGS
jgi:hypothetical protein